MDIILATLLTELELFGAENDARTTDRARRMLNITRDTGEFLSVLVRATCARRILEIGTSNGYSTLWLAEAARDIGGRVTTVEWSASKRERAARNFLRGNVGGVIELVAEDAGALLERTEANAYDFVFLDSERSEYVSWWPEIRRALDDGGLLVVDNATSHHDELLPLMTLVRSDPAFNTSLAPVGNGEFLAVKCRVDNRQTAQRA